MCALQFWKNKALIILLVSIITIAPFISTGRAYAGFDALPDLAPIHKYIGYGTLLMAAGSIITGATIPENSVHPGLSYAAMSLGVTACATGAIEYWNGPELEETNSKIHALVGIVSTVGFIAALALADGGSHKTIGGVSGGTFIITPIVLYF